MVDVWSYFYNESKRWVKWAIVRSLKYESVNDDARIEGDRLSTKLGN